jgi:hypothetical protein
MRRIPRAIKSALLLWSLSQPLTANACIAPAWAKQQGLRRDGDIVVITCMAEAPTDELAETRAKQTCDNLASSEVINRTKLEGFSSSQKNFIGPPAELAGSMCVVGIECETPGQRTCMTQNSAKVWRRCTYNLERARVGRPEECQVRKPEEVIPTHELYGPPDLRDR